MAPIFWLSVTIPMSVTVIYPLLVNLSTPTTATVPGFDRPVNAVFSADGSTAYILNCGPECGSGSASASVQTLDMATLTLGTPIPVDGATIGWLSGSTLYVAGTPTASVSNPTPNNSCSRPDHRGYGLRTSRRRRPGFDDRYQQRRHHGWLPLAHRYERQRPALHRLLHLHQRSAMLTTLKEKCEVVFRSTTPRTGLSSSLQTMAT